MKYLPLFLVLFLSGCTMLQFGGTTTKGHNIPGKPVHQEPEMKIGKQQAIDVVVQLGHEANKVGIGANTQQAETLLEMGLLLQIVEGVPVEQINWDDKKKIKALVEDVKEMEADYREKVMEWEALLRDLAESQDKMVELHKKNSWLQTVIGWLVFVGIILAIVCFLFPSVGIPLVFKILGKAKRGAEVAMKESMEAAETQFGQVVNAIEETKEKIKEQSPEVYKELQNNLRKNTDSATREVINKLKNKTHK